MQFKKAGDSIKNSKEKEHDAEFGKVKIDVIGQEDGEDIVNIMEFDEVEPSEEADAFLNLNRKQNPKEKGSLVSHEK